VRLLLTALLAAAASSVEAHDGWGVASTPDRRVFFTDTRRSIVWRIDPDGTRAPALEDTHSHALVTIGDGYVYGTNAPMAGAVRTVWRIDEQLRVQELLRQSEGDALTLDAFLIDDDGTVYSASRSSPGEPVALLRRDRNGIVETVADGFTAINGLAWTPDRRRIFVVDGAFLKWVARDGGAVDVLGGGALGSDRRDLRGVVANGWGGAFVVDFGSGGIFEVGDGFAAHVQYTAVQPWFPAGVARDADGLLVLEHLRRPWSLLADAQVGPYLRVRRLGTKGRVQTLAVLWGTRTWMAATAIAAMTAVALLSSLPRRQRWIPT
jgi:hypothetical protein